MKKIDIDSWKRKEHFEFFGKMKSPYTGFTTEVDCTKAYRYAKEKGISFYAWYLYKSMQAANLIEEMKYRIIDGEVYLLDTLLAGSTAVRSDGTFAFIGIVYNEDFETFYADFKKEIEETNNSTGMRFKKPDKELAQIRCSVVPWVSFTQLVHPTNFTEMDSEPKLVFGKCHERDGRLMMPFSIEVNHGLMDGYHLAKYMEEFQRVLNE